jgi:hypothetical protein
MEDPIFLRGFSELARFRRNEMGFMVGSPLADDFRSPIRQAQGPRQASFLLGKRSNDRTSGRFRVLRVQILTIRGVERFSIGWKNLRDETVLFERAAVQCRRRKNIAKKDWRRFSGFSPKIVS